MERKKPNPILSSILVLILVSLACGTAQPTPTSTPEPTVTNSAVPTNTPRPSPTPQPTPTPDLAATQRAEELNAEVQTYFDKGYLATTNGRFNEVDDFSYNCAWFVQYDRLPLQESASDFFL